MISFVRLADTLYNRDRCKDRNRRAALFSESAVHQDQNFQTGHEDCSGGLLHSNRAGTNRYTIPKRCRPCRTIRNHWTGNSRRALFLENRRVAYFRSESGPARYLPAIAPPALIHRLSHRAYDRVHHAQRTPIRLQLADASLTMWHMPARRASTHERRGVFHGPLHRNPAPRGGASWRRASISTRGSDFRATLLSPAD